MSFFKCSFLVAAVNIGPGLNYLFPPVLLAVTFRAARALVVCFEFQRLWSFLTSWCSVQLANSTLAWTDSRPAAVCACVHTCALREHDKSDIKIECTGVFTLSDCVVCGCNCPQHALPSGSYDWEGGRAMITRSWNSCSPLQPQLLTRSTLI